VYFRGEVWSIAGEEEHVKRNDVYHSRDGKQWQKAARPPWSARRWHSAIVFRDRLWIIGGEGEERRSDVWATADGEVWEQVSAQTPWSRRGRHATVVWHNRLCVVGGGDFSRPLRDVWCSTDGRAWTMVASQAPWTPRIGAGVTVWDDKLWVFGGSAVDRAGDASWLNDVWSSSDGSHWELQTARAPWTPRAAEYQVVFRDRVWIFGGKGIEAGNRGGFADDVWSLRRVAE
jgi:N-acetylneuraminic acid mutarotase